MFWFSSKGFQAGQALAQATIIISNQTQFEDHLLREINVGGHRFEQGSPCRLKGSESKAEDLEAHK